MGMTPSSLIWGDDSTPEVICGFMACMLMAISSIALYMSQSRETGVLGFIAALLLMIGNLLVALIFMVCSHTAFTPKKEHSQKFKGIISL